MPMPPVPSSCSVVWSAGGVLRKQFSAGGPLLQACWAHFQNTGPDAILCLLQPGSLAVHSQARLSLWCLASAGAA